MSSGFASVRCIRCGAYTQGVTQFCADCMERQRAEEAARAERVTQTIADRPAGPTSAAGGVCPSCGRYGNPGAKFCGYCRYQFRATAGGVEACTATGRRFIAGVIDAVLLIVVFTVMALAFADVDDGGNNQVVRVGLSNEEYLLYLGIVYGYYVVLEALTGASLGKLLLGLRVVKTNGQPYDLGAILLRNLIRFIDSIPFGFYIIGLICISLTDKKQRLGDLAAGTTVVRALTSKTS